MPDLKITELPAATLPLAGTEKAEIVQGGVNKQVNVSEFGGGGGGTVTSVTGTTNRITSTGGATPVIDIDPAYDAAITSAMVGVQDLFIPASYFSPTITSGCSPLTQNEIVTSLLNLQTLDFDNTTQENAQYVIVLPRKSTLTGFTYRVYWMASAGVASETVRWALAAVAYSNDDPLTGAFGSFVTVDDALTAVNDLHITDETSSVAAASPSSGDLIAIQIQRQPGSDNLAADARLIGVSMRITTTAAKDA
jgi:hypothetical protein